MDLNPNIMVDGLALVTLEDFNDWAKPYDKDTIYKEDYKWLDVDIPTYSVKTFLIVNESKLNNHDRKKITALMEGLQSNLTSLKIKGHYKWNDVDLNNWEGVEWEKYK